MDRNRRNKKYSNNWNNHKNFDNQNRRNQNNNHNQNKEKTYQFNHTLYQNDELEKERQKAIAEIHTREMKCGICGELISDISSAISDKNSGKPVHFDCVIKKLESENVEKRFCLCAGSRHNASIIPAGKTALRQRAGYLCGSRRKKYSAMGSGTEGKLLYKSACLRPLRKPAENPSEIINETYSLIKNCKLKSSADMLNFYNQCNIPNGKAKSLTNEQFLDFIDLMKFVDKSDFKDLKKVTK